MRELKFRAWDGERMHYDNFAIDHNGKIYWTSIRRVAELTLDNRIGEPANVKLMQYTGLKDKNGKEIYEGDICKANGIGPGTIKKAVSFSTGQFKFEHTPVADYLNVEVIGNVYSDPELFNEESK